MDPFQISKQTEDKVKLAKKIIQDKYQNIIFQQKLRKQKWDEIIKSVNNNYISQTHKKQLEKQLISHQLQQKRLTRQKDSLNNYELFQLIGKGAFGQVRIARNKQSNKIVAIKRIEKKRLVEKKQLGSAYIEKELMIKNNDSKFLVNLYSTFQDRNYLYLVMEYVAGGDMLHYLIKRQILTENETRFYIAELIVALQQMQSRNMIHRDIKPDNILIDKSGHIKISDFGLSKHMITMQNFTANSNSRFQDRKSSHKHHNTHKFSEKQNITIEKILKIKERTAKVFSKVGTPDYISPQVLFAKQYDYSVDIWSVGVIMFECLFGYPPFSDEDPKQVCKNVVNWSIILKFPSEIPVSVDAKRLILGMITQRSQRLGIEQIKGHSFFSGIQWNKIKQCQPPMIPILDSELDTRYFEQFDQSQKWVDQSLAQVQSDSNPQAMQNNNKRARSSAKVRSTSADYLFAGFDFKNIKAQPFKIIENQVNHSNSVKGFTRKSSHNFLKGSPSLKENRKLIKNMTDNKNVQKDNEKKTQNQCLRKYLIKKSIHLLGDSVILNPNQTTNSFINTSSKLNHSTSNAKEKPILCKESMLKQTRKIFTWVKNTNKVVM